MLPLQSKLALVTGASRGLGEAIARQLWSAGASLALVARDSKALEELAASLPEAPSEGQRLGVFPADIADIASLEASFAGISAQLGDVDVLVNNAAIQGPLGPLESIDFAAWKQVFDVDLFAAVRLCQLVIPGMRRRGGGKIINISGGGATGPRPDVTAYACAKTALVRLAETLAEELKDARIDVNSVSPGAMNTRMLEETLAAGPAGIRREFQQAMERKQKGSGVPPEKAAELVVFLASPASDGISGKIISAVWDPWRALPGHLQMLANSDVFTLRRITEKDRQITF
ncbi:SDR family NAD(P)-dependent oxidoreductase [Humisphaera borealis]|uniref:SDR family oxidoreductase n=1 Tax=Humisphaera borealis TaxID=2807512 RepID=A0A7M2WR22_9BACT|nr:SDR family oxidoreductase [Humisphaera borealis]QOV87883.1 SDR family oxidoreductase [Humisphaera borealis]